MKENREIGVHRKDDGAVVGGKNSFNFNAVIVNRT